MTIQPLSNADEARARAERIREGVRVLVEWRHDVVEAWARRDDQVLGYPTWSDYVHGEFDVLPRLDKPERDALMVLLAEAGMPQRQIGATAGVDHSTVSRAVRGANAPRPGRAGRTSWSRKVESISARLPIDDLTDDEVEEVLGAAEFLGDLCRGTLRIRRKGNGGSGAAD